MPAQQKQFSRLAQALIFAAAIVFVPTASADDSERVTIAYGTVQGTTRASGVRAFLGIPYAAPPVGKLRWMPPQPVKVWDGVRVCTSSGPWCPQPAPLFGNETGPQDEDCLYLNVWSPEPQENVRFPVMVWIHGGGWTTGSGAQSMYDGERLAQEGIVVVTINYRLGPFGFFAHPLLSAESGNGTSGNYGMMDQIEALRWVKQNIAAFNGDKDCVTIFGESAGGGSVARLLVSPPAAGLFHRAIIQSSGLEGYNAHLRYHWYDSEPMEVVGERIAAQLVPKTTDMLGDLREKSWQEILRVSAPETGLFRKGNSFHPIVDGMVIPDDPRLMLERGNMHDVPVLLGANANEATIFTKSVRIKNEQDYKAVIQKEFDERSGDILRLFPVQNGNAKKAFNDVTGIMGFVSGTRRLASTLSSVGKGNVFLYHFSRVPPSVLLKELGAFHSAEIPYIFGHPEAWSPRKRAADIDKALSDTMLSAWVRFAKTGDPNGGTLPAWPAYDPKSDACMEFGDVVAVRTNLHREACDLSDAIAAERNIRERQGFTGN
jgi:para-nitrobenzyl esterase